MGIKVRPNVIWVPGAKKISAPYRGDGPHKALFHATITGSMTLPGYRSQTQNPHETMLWDPVKKKMFPRTHLYFDQYAKALENDAGGVETNNDCVLQWELAGYLGSSTPSGGFDILEAPDIYWEQLADLIGDIVLSWGVKERFSRSFDAGVGERNLPKRMSFTEWDGWNGFCTHLDVPENAHWDLPAGARAKSILSKKIYGEEDVMATAEEVAKAVWDTLIPKQDGTDRTAYAKSMLGYVDIRTYRAEKQDVIQTAALQGLVEAVNTLAQGVEGVTGEQVLAKVEETVNAWLDKAEVTVTQPTESAPTPTP